MANLGEFGGAVAAFVVEDPDTFTFYGQEFRARGAIGLMPLLRFAAVAQTGAGTEDVEGLVAIHDMLHDAIHPDDWEKFQATATQMGADADTLLAVVRTLIAAAAARPTSKPSGSPDGLSPTGPSLRDDSFSRVPDGLVPVDLGV